MVPTRLVARMADRLWRLGSKARRDAFVGRARKRLDGGSRAINDAAAVLAASSPPEEG